MVLMRGICTKAAWKNVHWKKHLDLLFPLQKFQAPLQFKSAEHLCQWPGIANWFISFCNIKQQRYHCWFRNNFGVSCRRGFWSLCQCGEFHLGNLMFFNWSIIDIALMLHVLITNNGILFASLEVYQYWWQKCYFC